MKIAIIPARGGSKRIPRKNIKEFLGKPVIAYSIQAAIDSQLFDRIIVSTDNQEIASIARQYGADIPFIRPSELSDDFADTLSVIQHALIFCKKQGVYYENTCCIYATAPFVTSDTLIKAHQQFEREAVDYVFTATAFHFPVQRGFVLTEQKRIQMMFPEHFSTRSQDLPQVYHDAGQFYWGKTESFLKKNPIFAEYSSPFLLPTHQVQDIDTIEDWEIAEFKYQYLQKIKGLS